MIEPEVRVVAYQVSCLPPDHPEAPHFTLEVVARGYHRWAVTRFGFCYDAKGHERYEPNPSARTDAFKHKYRHSLDDALALAKRLAPTITVNGHTVEDVIRR